MELLNFLGINYRANIWINGQKVADANDVAGTYRSYEFNVSSFESRGKRMRWRSKCSLPEKMIWGSPG